MKSFPNLKAPSVESLTPSGGQDIGDYWTYITAMAIVLFVFYCANEGLLSEWLKLFVYSAPASVAPAGANAGDVNASVLETLGGAAASVASDNGLTGAAVQSIVSLTPAGSVAAVVKGGMSVYNGFVKQFTGN